MAFRGVARAERRYRFARSITLLVMDSEHCASDFVIEAWVAKRWRRIARSGYEVTARRLFDQLSYRCPAETILRYAVAQTF